MLCRGNSPRASVRTLSDDRRRRTNLTIFVETVFFLSPLFQSLIWSSPPLLQMETRHHDRRCIGLLSVFPTASKCREGRRCRGSARPSAGPGGGRRSRGRSRSPRLPAQDGRTIAKAGGKKGTSSRYADTVIDHSGIHTRSSDDVVNTSKQ